MTLPAPTYDLVLLLDTLVEADARAKIVADARASIEAQGELLRYDAWGERAMAYPIERKANADYHLFQFHAPAAELLSGLDRTLRITDGILRFRIIKLAPGVPDAPDMGAGGVRRAEGEPAREETAAAPAAGEPPSPAAALEPAAPSAPEADGAPPQAEAAPVEAAASEPQLGEPA